jgi:hypothetical protein
MLTASIASEASSTIAAFVDLAIAVLLERRNALITIPTAQLFDSTVNRRLRLTDACIERGASASKSTLV